MGRLTGAGYAAVFLPAPVLALAAGWLALLVAGSTGTHPIWHVRPRSIAEAAVFRDGGAIVRRVRAGENPNTASEVRGGFISRRPVTITPIDAAVRAQRAEVVQLLFDVGATVDAASWTQLWCDAENTDVKAVLVRYRPPGVAPACGEAR